jgi:hypothetical protein
MDKKTVNELLLSVGGLMVFIPILINILMFINILPVSGDENSWIATLGTFWGAIIGGVISGAITLMGVRQTILFQSKKDRFEKLPELIVNSWKVYKKIIFIEGLRLAINDNPEINDIKIIDDFYNENEELLTELSARIDPRFYHIVNIFFTHVSDYAGFKKKEKLKEWFELTSEYSDQLADLIKSFEQEYSKQYIR